MKKLPFFIGLMCVLAVSCAAGKNEFGWYADFEAAKKAAKSQKKNILLFVSSFQDFEDSASAVALLTKSRAFTDAVEDSYVCVHFDFSKANILIEENDEKSTADKKNRLSAKQKTLQKQFSVADSYAVKETPQAVIATADGYYVGKADFNYGGADAAAYADALEAQKDTARLVNELTAAVKNSSGVKKAQAIDELYARTAQNCRAPLKDLVRLIPRIDKKNESGLVSSYLREGAYLDASERLKASGPAEAAAVYEKAAADERLNPIDRQLLYYAAANVLALNGSAFADRIISLLLTSVSAAPESPYAQKIALTADEAEKTLRAPDAASNADTAPPIPSPAYDSGLESGAPTDSSSNSAFRRAYALAER
ncbi:MAG: hypothetical protein ACTTKL_01045 [Treponema sp.]